MAAPVPAPPDVADWQALSLRLIAFPAQPLVDLPQQWWRGLFNEDAPEASRKREEREEHGPVGPDDSLLALKTELHRVTWGLGPNPASDPPDEPSLTVPTIGSFPIRSEWFVALMERWLGQPLGFQVKRLAMNCALLRQVPDRIEGYRMLGRYLNGSVTVDAEHSSDFLYRINRKQQLDDILPGLTVNRLNTWGVRKFNVLVGEIGASGAQPITQFGGDRFDIALDLDVNTDEHRRDGLPAELLPALFRRLSVKAVEIATRGDFR